MSRMRALMEKFNALQPRERWAVTAGAAVVALTAAWLGVYDPVVSSRYALERRIEATKTELTELAGLAERYQSIRRRFTALDAKLAAQPEDFSAVTAIESLAAAAGVSGQITSMTPQPPQTMEGYEEQPVTARLEEVTLPQLVVLLESARGAEHYLRVKRVSIRPQYKKPDLLDVTLTLAGYRVAR
ncbi:MAG: type II secretion system protein M [Nitrospinae bacterium]|nr:type II secretion system protein M [Nitrospinota bacterium]